MEWILKLGEEDSTVVARVALVGGYWIPVITIDGRTSATLGHFERDEIAFAVETAHTVAMRVARSKGLTAL